MRTGNPLVVMLTQGENMLRALVAEYIYHCIASPEEPSASTRPKKYITLT
jgi:hypothetical protein